MREGCKHFQSRSYDTGEVVRFCELDLAPEAPWRCPDDCASFAPATGGRGMAAREPGRASRRGRARSRRPRRRAAARGGADIVDAVVPETLAEVEKEERTKERAPALVERR